MATKKALTKTTVKTTPENETVDAVVTETETVSAENEKATVANSAASKKVTSTKKTYEPTDLIPVRSVTQGELIMPGKKSGIIYRWYAYGDVTEVEYQDLYTLKASRSGYIYHPRFLIEDEDLLADSRWKDVASIYEKFYSEDLDELLSMRPSEFEIVFRQLPRGIQDAVKIEVATRIDNGTFDSLSMIKAIDMVCGSDLICMVS